MAKKITIDWSSEKTIGDEIFPIDKLGRAKYATFLTQLLARQGFDAVREGNDQKRNYVLNLNSEWGSGKTYFLKRWADDLKADFPVVYIDAWQQDYSDDPLMTVISSVIKQLREQAGIPEDSTEFKIPGKVLGLLKAAAPALAKCLSKRYLGFDFNEFISSDDSENIQEESESGEPKDSSDKVDMGEVASSAVKHLIKEHDSKSSAIKNLKENVENWVLAVVSNITEPKEFPAFIFIDELDRCRPSYAVEMLETIKHIFDIKGIVFVVATDTEQLQHAVKAIYGEGFNARLYLGRFFNSRFSLKSPDLKDLLHVHVDSYKLAGENLRKASVEILPPNEDENITLRNISTVLDAFNLSPRTAIQIAERVITTVSNMPNGSKIDILMLTTLLCFNEENSDMYRRIIIGEKNDINGISLSDHMSSLCKKKEFLLK